MPTEMRHTHHMPAEISTDTTPPIGFEDVADQPTPSTTLVMSTSEWSKTPRSYRLGSPRAGTAKVLRMGPDGVTGLYSVRVLGAAIAKTAPVSCGTCRDSLVFNADRGTWVHQHQDAGHEGEPRMVVG